jgi:acyl-CoA synthetase (AMP-forming)/AMP-acid ligase II
LLQPADRAKSQLTDPASSSEAVQAPALACAAVELLDVFHPAAALDRVTRQGCTGTASPAPFVRMMLDAYDPAVHDVSRLRFWLTAGAPVPAALVEEAAARFSGCRVVPAYGSGEVMMATVCRPEDPVERWRPPTAAPSPASTCAALPAGSLHPLARRATSATYRGPGRLLEYWGRPDLTAEAMDDQSWWRTGDTGRLDETGYLRVTGRIKDIIIRGGFNVSAREVEEALLRMAAVTAAAVMGLPTPPSASEPARSSNSPRDMTRPPSRISTSI